MPEGIDFENLTVPQPTPPAGKTRMYFKDDRQAYVKEDNGTERVIGGQTVADVQAAVDILEFQPVTNQGQIADSANLGDMGQFLGLAMNDADTGFIVTCLLVGVITNLSWSWSPGDKVYLNGTTLSTTPPSSGFSQMIAVAKSADTLIVRPQQPILL